MSENCSSNCSSCSEDCSERKTDFSIKPHPKSKIKKVIGVVSGKGGVGKSLVTSMLASSMQKKGYRCGILDADITGPSIPKMFNIDEKASGDHDGIFPAVSEGGVSIVSINMFLDDDTDPVVWRGPIIAGTVKQFYSEVIWDDIDYLFVDMPPGTGDVALTVFQSLPVDGIVVVTSPQELVLMIVAKALKMAKLMNIPIIGLVENMSYFKCPSDGVKYYIFGESKLDEAAKINDLEILARLPIDPIFAKASDNGEIERVNVDYFDLAVKALETIKER